MCINVLIIDDHAGFRSLVRSLLETDGYVVVGEAADGASALAAATVLNPALVLLDVQLPDRDGFAVAQELTKHSPEVQIVLISTAMVAITDAGLMRVMYGGSSLKVSSALQPPTNLLTGRGTRAAGALLGRVRPR